jgi:preprotein translocase subunit SecE
MTKKPTAKPPTRPSRTQAKPAPAKGPQSKATGLALKTASPSGVEADKIELAPKKRVPIVLFFRQVRQEMRKITWPTRKETWITTVMVLIMVVLATIFFGIVDAGFNGLLSLLLGLRG